MKPAVTLLHGDCLVELKLFPDNSIDAVCTDPPYHLTSIVKRYSKTSVDADGTNEKRAKAGSDAMARLSRGFMGQIWDGGDVAFRVELWAEVLRVLKPGGHMLAFGGTRTYHRMVCAIEDAGFEVRDQLCWMFGTGFPKSHDVSKGIDAKLGAVRDITPSSFMITGSDVGAISKNRRCDVCGLPHASANPCRCLRDSGPATDAAREWQGWGTALKPAIEPICLARKPLSEPTVAANVLRWGTGALNIDACRVEAPGGSPSQKMREAARAKGTAPSVPGEYTHTINDRTSPERYMEARAGEALGRWPANVLHDGSNEVIAAFPSPHGAGTACGPKFVRGENLNVYGKANTGAATGSRFGDSGSAARFFYSAKASKHDRIGSKHPTVKPVELMRYLCRLITPPGGTVLDPFAGTGTTAAAAFLEGFGFVIIEQDKTYVRDIRRRMRRYGLHYSGHNSLIVGSLF